jgi:cytochrome c biogenesis protein CcdA
MEKELGVSVEWNGYPVNDPENFERLLFFERDHISGSEFPVVIVGTTTLAGKAAIDSQLRSVIVQCRITGGCSAAAMPAAPGMQERARASLRLAPIVMAAVADSVNPCTFATIIFFMSYMALVLRQPRITVLLTGLSFIAGVFITYLLIGIGALAVVQRLSAMLRTVHVMYALVALLALYLGYRHLRDAVHCARGGSLEESISVKLPSGLRSRINAVLQKAAATRYVYLVVFFAAGAVTLLELACTGQVYLPTIIYLTSQKSLQLQAVSYLVLYCAIFVAPLGVIFVLYYFGLTTAGIKRFFTKNIVFSKVVLSVFFIVLSIVMFFQMLH